MNQRIMTVAVRQEQDVVSARQRARHIAAQLGFDAQDQARIATAVSEIARNAFRYAGGGEAEFVVEGERAPQVLAINVRDSGKGIQDLDAVLTGRYRSATGMGLGITGARRLMDHCVIESSPGGTAVFMKKVLPDPAPVVDAAVLARIATALTTSAASTPLDEVQQQNRELIRTMGELRERQDELLNLNRELEDTNRGVVALYAELEERADFLRRADELKTRFLSNMSHEFRTPLNSIRALTQLLLDRTDGPVTEEQATQLEFIRKATEQLSELVEDLLDLAKIEAGKVEVRPEQFGIEELFSALRGMLRPLLVSDSVALRFEAKGDLPKLVTDENKLSQILRNFISNALKFTERGEIRVTAERAADADEIVIAVADTGIGIPAEDHERIFEEFTQVRNPLQSRVKGTGLGLPLCRRLAALLGGSLSLKSAPGEGSTFSVTLPFRFSGEQASPATQAPAPPTEAIEPSRVPVLIVEDQQAMQLLYERWLRGSPYAPVPARSLREAREAIARQRPAAVILDIVLGRESSWRWLGELKSSADAPPVIVSSEVDDPRKAYSLGADLFLPKPVDPAILLSSLDRLAGSRILLIDDDPAARYAIRRIVDRAAWQVIEAADAGEGVRAATALRPELIVLDLDLPDRRGEDVLDELASGATTRGIPVIIATSEDLSAEKRERLCRSAAAVCSKGQLDRAMFARLLGTLNPPRQERAG